MLLATTGMRRGEALGLRRCDIDLEAGSLSIRQTLVCIGAELHVSKPKTARGKRVVALDPHTISVLRKHLRGAAGDNEAIVFTDEEGRPLQPTKVTKTFYKLVAASGLPSIRLHDLRHTHATIALEAGIHPKIVSERLGHSTVSFTLDVYSHAVPHMQKDAAEKIARLVLGP